jgi:hypothetical protein
VDDQDERVVLAALLGGIYMALQPLYGKPSSKNYINPPRVLDNAEEFMDINDTIKAFTE